ncbi:MAG: hypothetical protein V1765_03250 [bacterium]
MLSAHSALASFGITPPWIRNKTLSRGAVFEQEMIIVRSDPKEDLEATLTFAVPEYPEIEDWFTIDKGKTFTLPQGEKQIKILVRVDVPKKAKYGQYQGAIHLNTKTTNYEQGVVNIALGVQIDIDLAVVDLKIFDFVIRGVKMPDSETGHKFLFWFVPGKIKALVNYENLGNIPSHPTKAVLTIYDKNKQVLEELTSTKRMQEVEPFTTEEIPLLFKHKLPAGSYLAELKIYKDEEIKFQGEVTVSILAYKDIPDKGLSPLTITLIVIVIVLIGSAGYFWFKQRGFRRKK